MDRGFERLRGDMSLFFTGLFGQAALALIISSVFYNLKNDTASLYSRGALLFFAILMAAFQSMLEVSLCTEEKCREVSDNLSRF